MIENDSFKKKLAEAINKSLIDLLAKIQNEHIYALSLFTSGEDDFSYLCISANTEEGLREKANQYREKENNSTEVASVKSLRWSVPDWKYHNFSTEVAALELPDDSGPKSDARIYNIFVSCLKTLRKNALIKNKDVAYLITCGDMSDEFLLKGIKKLNSAEFVKKYIEEYTPIPFITYLESLSESTRLDTVINLYRDLSLNVSSDLCIEARSRNVDHFVLHPVIAKFGSSAVPRLLDIIEENGFKRIYYDRSSEECKKYGICTLENNLSTSSALLIEDCGHINDTETARMQALIKKLIEHQSTLTIKSTLPENLARVLHALKPKMFPPTVMNPETNFLENYNEYIF